MLAPTLSSSARQLRNKGGSAALASARKTTTTSMHSSTVKKTPSMLLNRVPLDLRRQRRLRSLVAASSSDTGSATLVSRDEEENEVASVASSSSSSSSPLVVMCPPPTSSSSAALTNNDESNNNNTNTDTDNNNKKRLALFVASAALAHPDKAHYGGEDAWFHSPVSGTIGVADGVGGWADSGICPAEYARELMAAARSAAEGVPPRLVTVESLAESRGSGGGASAAGTTTTPAATAATAADGGGGRAEGFGVPLSCFDAAGGGAPPPNASAAAAAAAAAATAAVPANVVSSEYGEDGGVPSLSSLLLPRPLTSSSSGSAPSLPRPSLLPTAALSAAHAAVRLPGSATACVVTLDEENGTLHGVSVGDAGALVVRKRRSSSGSGSSETESESETERENNKHNKSNASGIVLFRSRPTYHSFDCPRQLAAAPEHVEWSDEVADGEKFEVEGLEAGDVVIIASDGVFDNAWTDELLALLPDFPSPNDDGGGGGASSSSPPSRSSPSSTSDNSVVARDVAERIARLAAQNSRDELYPSPYAAEAAAAGITGLGGVQQGDGNDLGAAISSFASKLFGGSQDDDEGDTRLVGGKLDDITVVVAVVGRV